MKVASARRLISALAIALAATALASAQGPGNLGMGQEFGGHRPPMERAFGPEGRDGRWWNNPRMIERLKLTDEQRKEMDAILFKHRENLIDLRANLEKVELAMQPLVNADQPDENAILAQIDKVASARADLEKADARFLLDIRSKLTPEQWKELRDMRQDRAMDHPRGPRPEQWRQRQGGAPPAPANPPAQPTAPPGY